MGQLPHVVYCFCVIGLASSGRMISPHLEIILAPQSQSAKAAGPLHENRLDWRNAKLLGGVPPHHACDKGFLHMGPG